MESIRIEGPFPMTITILSMILFSIQVTFTNLTPPITSAAYLSTATLTIPITFTLIIVGLSDLETGVFAASEEGAAVLQQRADPVRIAVCDEKVFGENAPL